MSDRPGAEWWRPDVEVASGAPPATVDAARPKAAERATPFWALMAFTFILFVAPQSFVPVLAPLRIALLTGGFAIAAYLLDAFLRGRPIRLSTEARIAAGLVAWALVGVPLSYWPGGSLSVLLGMYLKPVALFWLLSEVAITVPRLRLIAWALTLMTVPMAATALDNFISGEFMEGAEPRILGYEAPLTANPNGLALVLCLILPLSLALFQMARRTSVRAVLLAIIALDVVGVVLTFSRGGFLTLALVMGMYLCRLLRRPERPWAIATLVLLLVSLPLVPSSYFERMATIRNIHADPTGSAQSRLSDIVTAARYVVANPLVGAGIGQSVIALNEERGATWLLVHNVYLLYAVDLGIPGLLLFVLLLVRCIKSARFVRRRTAGQPAFRDLFYLAEGIYTSLITFALGAHFHTVAYEFHFYYFAGLAVAARSAYQAEAGNGVSAGQVSADAPDVAAIER
jgi:putative inorganic carbon (HCO3(-)) transporter